MRRDSPSLQLGSIGDGFSVRGSTNTWMYSPRHEGKIKFKFKYVRIYITTLILTVAEFENIITGIILAYL